MRRLRTAPCSARRARSRSHSRQASANAPASSDLAQAARLHPRGRGGQLRHEAAVDEHQPGTSQVRQTEPPRVARARPPRDRSRRLVRLFRNGARFVYFQSSFFVVGKPSAAKRSMAARRSSCKPGSSFSRRPNAARYASWFSWTGRTMAGYQLRPRGRRLPSSQA